ncbi:MAG TPA: PIN domain nuclease [Lentisphaeria bacterium]|nr:MAG: hypothetical protein A2X47_02425 [Lentisphaerae bacterium GWF2_38_69]HBM17426.1 PIN domain nuclease [Lentisphaeria bacterium]
MRVLIDTCIWSQVLRRKDQNLEYSAKVAELITQSKVAIIGPIRQELLSGISDNNQFIRLKKHLEAFQDISLKTEHFVKASEFSNLCRSKGVQGSAIDFLICAVSVNDNLTIYTDDNDFESYLKYLPINLLK